MLSLLALLALWSPIPGALPGAQDTQEAVLIELENALLGGDSEQLVRALSLSSRVRDLRVARASTLALRHANVAVQTAALDALRFNSHPTALPTLHALFKDQGKFLKRHELRALLLQATAQHGDRESLPLLVEGGFRNDPAPVLRARILGLGRIRDKGSVSALMDGMQTLSHRERLLHMDEFRLALTQLTSQDYGLSARGWIGWWEKNRDDYHLRTDSSTLGPSLQLEWETYWSRPAEVPRVIPLVKAPPAKNAKKKQGQPVNAAAKKGKQGQGNQGKNNKNKQAPGKGKQGGDKQGDAKGKQNGDKPGDAAGKQDGKNKQGNAAGKQDGKNKQGNAAGKQDGKNKPGNAAGKQDGKNKPGNAAGKQDGKNKQPKQDDPKQQQGGGKGQKGKETPKKA